jgi:hypothetical protein
MTDLDEKTCEQLSAWMDGALPADEARFLERRLEHDPALRAKWERLQLASSTLRGHALRPMPATLPLRIAEGIAAQAPARGGRAWIGWAVAASVAVAMVALVPRFMSEAPPSAPIADAAPVIPAPVEATPVDAPTPAPAIDGLRQATPGSADFIASEPTVASPSTEILASADVPPDALESPEDFPLDPAAPPKSWPRSSAPGGAEAAMEGYLVRHSEMAGADALGGFVPYLDVVAANDADQPETPAPAPAPAQERK